MMTYDGGVSCGRAPVSRGSGLTKVKRQTRGAIVMVDTQAAHKPFAGEVGYAVSNGAFPGA